MKAGYPGRVAHLESPKVERHMPLQRRRAMGRVCDARDSPVRRPCIARGAGGRCTLRPAQESFSMATKSRKKPAAVTEDEVFDIAAELFRAMAAPMRLKIVSLLCNGEKNVSELLAEIDTTQPNMSQHLNTLYQAGVLARRREGVSIYYSIANETVVALCRSICVQIAIEQA
jgi:DNA-binding transcriptional ArsR family regulator